MSPPRLTTSCCVPVNLHVNELRPLLLSHTINTNQTVGVVGVNGDDVSHLPYMETLLTNHLNSLFPVSTLPTKPGDKPPLFAAPPAPFMLTFHEAGTAFLSNAGAAVQQCMRGWFEHTKSMLNMQAPPQRPVKSDNASLGALSNNSVFTIYDVHSLQSEMSLSSLLEALLLRFESQDPHTQSEDQPAPMFRTFFSLKSVC